VQRPAKDPHLGFDRGVRCPGPSGERRQPGQRGRGRLLEGQHDAPLVGPDEGPAGGSQVRGSERPLTAAASSLARPRAGGGVIGSARLPAACRSS
jgi:hypothetical protein